MSKDKPPQKEEKDFWDGCAGFGNGLWDSVESAATGIWDMVSSPLETAASMFKAVIHPIDTINNIAYSIEKYLDDNWTNGDTETRSMVVGRIIGEVVIGILGTKGADKLSKSIKAAKAAGKAKVGAKASKLIGPPSKPMKNGGKLKGKKSNGKKGKGSPEDGKKPMPYTNSRPRLGKKLVEEVYENSKDPITGKVYDPTGVEIKWDKSKPRNGQWDMGHIPGQEYSKIHKKYLDGKMSKKEFLEWYRDPKNYRPELPSTNRSHKYEKK